MSQNGWIGIDVGAATLKLAQLTRRGGRLELSASATVERSAAGDNLSAIRNDLEAVLAIAGELQGKRTAATLPPDVCLVEPGRIATPIVNDEETRQWSTASWPTGIESRDPEIGWYTLAARTDHSEAVADGLLDAGLSCRAIDGHPLAIARAVGMVTADPSVCKAGIDWGWTSARLVCTVGGCPVYVRRLKGKGFNAAIDLVADELGVSPEEARDALRRHPPAAPGSDVTALSPLAVELSTLVRPVFDRLLSEVHKTLAHVRSHRQQATPEALCLMGGGAALPGVAAWLGAETKLPTTLWCPPGVVTDNRAWPTLASAIALSALAWEAR